MKPIKHFIALLLYIALFVPLAQAESAPDKQQEAQAIALIREITLGGLGKH